MGGASRSVCLSARHGRQVARSRGVAGAAQLCHLGERQAPEPIGAALRRTFSTDFADRQSLADGMRRSASSRSVRRSLSADLSAAAAGSDGAAASSLVSHPPERRYCQQRIDGWMDSLTLQVANSYKAQALFIGVTVRQLLLSNPW
jgi:hypothetical protein